MKLKVIAKTSSIVSNNDKSEATSFITFLISGTIGIPVTTQVIVTEEEYNFFSINQEITF